MKKIATIVIALLMSSLTASAQYANTADAKLRMAAPASDNKPVAFRHLDLSFTAGTPGLGFDLSTPVTKWLDLRAGATFMPHFKVNADFDVVAGKIEGQHYVETGKFSQMADLFKSMTGYDVRDHVTMVGHPTGNNFSFMLDFKPAKNWHISAGFYWGNAQFAEGINSLRDAATLLGVGMFNNMRDNLGGINLPSSLTGELYNRMIESRDSWGDKPWMSIGNIDLNIDPMMTDEEVRDYCNTVTTAMMNGMFNGALTAEDIDNTLGQLSKLRDYGYVGVYMGDYKRDVFEYNEDGSVKRDESGSPVYKRDAAGNPIRQGSPYVMIPDHDGTVSVKVKTNKFKPYLGFGYGGEIARKAIPGLSVSFDAGIMFWGGSPAVLVHDGTDLVHDVRNVRGKVGTYVKAITNLRVYPVVSLRITKRLF